MRKTKILIIGPIGNFGGREIETNILIKSLSSHYDVRFLSTGYMTSDSFALKNNFNIKWSTIDKEVYTNKLFFKFLAICSKIFNRSKKKTYSYINNSISKKLKLKQTYKKIIEEAVKESSRVIFCGQLSSSFLDDIIGASVKFNNKIYFRTTGTIRNLKKAELTLFDKIHLFIHHSEENADLLNVQKTFPYVVIDQCSLYEDTLLKLIINSNKPLRYGYIGRFSEEKGILPLTNYFCKNNKPFVIAGSGPQEKELVDLIKNNKNCKFIGFVKSEKIDSFFSKIDILIIPSYEEAGPLVGVEALAAGKIIISTKVGAMQERLQNTKNQFWFDIFNLNTLHEIIEYLEKMDVFKLQNLMANNRNLYREKFSLKKIQSKYKELLNENDNQ